MSAEEQPLSAVPEPGVPETDVRLPGALVNLRDVAHRTPGLVAGVLLRSDAPLAGDRPPVERWWPPATVIDLRDQAEKRERHPLHGGAVVLDLPLFDRGAATPPTSERALPNRLADIYLTTLTAPLASNLVAAVTAVETAEPPVLVHCSAGKDRTGVVVAVVLRMIGVEPDQIIADYALTAAAMPAVQARMDASVAVMTEGARLATLPPHILAATPADMGEFISVLDAHDGGAVGWFVAHGGRRQVVDGLRRKLLA